MVACFALPISVIATKQIRKKISHNRRKARKGLFSEVICSVIVCLSAILIVRGRMTIGEMIIFETYMAYFITPIKRFAELNVTYSKSIAGIERVFDILDIEPEIQEKENALIFPDKEDMRIKFQNVYFKYDKTASEYILKDISFSVEPGEKVALVGASGCGKSTVISLLARFYDIDSGKISFGNRDLYDYSLASIYKQTGT